MNNPIEKRRASREVQDATALLVAPHGFVAARLVDRSSTGVRVRLEVGATLPEAVDIEIGNETLHGEIRSAMRRDTAWELGIQLVVDRKTS